MVPTAAIPVVNYSEHKRKELETQEVKPRLSVNRKEINNVHTVIVREWWMDLLVEI
jgi:hypothetical protein